MKCVRCGARSPGATWYCPRCGSPLSDIDVASHRREPLPAMLRWSLALSAFALAVIAAVSIAAVAWRALRPAAPSRSATSADVAPQAAMVPSEAVTAARTATPPGGARSGEGAVSGALAPGDSATASVDPNPPTPARGVGAPAPTPYIRPDVPVWRVRRAARPPRIDGDLIEWTQEPIEIVAVVFGDAHWRGPDDLSARAFGNWDDAALYLGVQVIDDVFSQPARASRLYLGDSLELQLDVDLVDDARSDRYSDDDWQIGLSPGDFASAAPETYVWRPSGRDPSGIELGARRLDNGYVVEAALPWASLAFDPGRARSLGLAMNISDNDGPAPAQMTMISVAPSRSWNDPTTFAVLVLEDR